MAIFLFLAAGLIYGLISGRGRLAAVLVGTYLAAFIFENLSFLDSLLKGRSTTEVFVLKAVGFFVLLVLTSLLIRRLISKRDFNSRGWWQIFILSVLESGLLTSILARLLPGRELFTFSPLVQNIFLGDTAFLIWLLLPLSVLWFISR